MLFSDISSVAGFSSISVAISRHACRVLATLGLISLAACATPGPAAPASPAKTDTDLVTQRASARWDALVKDDLDAAYAMMSPGSRDAVSLDKFKSNIRRGAFRSAKVENVTCDAGACMVKLVVTYDHPKMKGITTPVSESWIVDGGQAWYVYGGG